MSSRGVIHKHFYYLKFGGMPSGSKSIKMFFHMRRFHFIYTRNILLDNSFGIEKKHFNGV